MTDHKTTDPAGGWHHTAGPDVEPEDIVSVPHHPLARKPIIMTTTELLAHPPDQLQWAVTGLLPTGLALLAAKPKEGKSWMALGTVLGSGGLGPADDRPALYIGLEDTQRRLYDRVKKLLGDAPRPAGAFLSCDWPSGAEGLAELDGWLEGHKGTRLVVLDTLAVFLAGRDRSRDVYQADYEALRPLKKLADKHGCCILGIVHVRKEKASDPFNTLVGTTGVTGCADAVLVLSRPRCGTEAVLHVTGRDVEEQRLALRWHPDGCRWEVAGDAGAMITLTPERREVVEAICRIGPCGPAKLAQEMGKNPDAVKKLLRRMEEAGTLVCERGVYHVPPVPGVLPVSPVPGVPV
ncbi:MAG: hypothetical protein C0467_17605 [Planctomycetaceae bacterium]|nr:hypothetical protein [Planctomycetaceae bacterium]